MLTKQELKGNYSRCKECRGRTILGVRCANDDLWHLRRFVVARDNTSRRRPLLQCSWPNCDQTYMYNTFHKRERKMCRLHGMSIAKRKPWSQPFSLLRAVTKRLGTKMTITYEQFKALCEKMPNCAYCDRPVSRRPFALANMSAERAYCLDKINPTAGYTLENVVSCCFTCNATKRASLSPEEMRVIALMRTGRREKAASVVIAASPPDNWPGWRWEATYEDMDARIRKSRERSPEAWAKQVALMNAAASAKKARRLAAQKAAQSEAPKQ